ncbi:MAG: hypothetical protein HY528_04020 [Chloroflexi bacterium]|nr:hypothetical protein [Chloroflexota bacterium]
MDTEDVTQATEFRSLLEELRKQLLDACIHFDIWEELWPTVEVVGTINRFKGFFLPTRNAHLSQFFIKVCNVVSNDPKSPSLYRVLKMLDNNQQLAPGINTRSLHKRLRQYRKVLEGISDYRNTKAAHWDTQQMEQRKPVLFGDAKQMLKELQDIFNEIHKAHVPGNLYAFKTLQASDTSHLLEVLKVKPRKSTGNQL